MIGLTELPAPVGGLLSHLEQATVLCRAAPPWPGWLPGVGPVLVSLKQGGTVLAGVDRPPVGFRRVRAGDGLRLSYRPGYLETRPLATGVLAGRPQVAVIGGEPIPAIVYSPARDAVVTFGLLIRDLFRATLACDLAAAIDATAATGEEEDIPAPDELAAGDEAGLPPVVKRRAALLRQCQLGFERYPETDVLNNVLGNLEGRMLYGHLTGSGFGDQASRLAGEPGPAAVGRAFALVRRERHAGMGPAAIAYERRMEVYEGLPRYVELTLLRMIAGNGTPIVEGFGQRAGDGLREQARRLVAARFGMLIQLNVHAWGASRRRFYHSGAAVGLLLDDVVPAWRLEVAEEGHPLDVVLEGAVHFDGANVDEGLLESARRYYGYYERLEDEQSWEREMSGRRRELLAKVFSARGTRVTVDVSALSQKTAWYDSSTAQRIGESVRVHVRPGVFTYGDGATFIECRGLVMVEDIRSGLLHVTVPGTNLRITGDREDVGPRGAEFTEGLVVDLGGLRVRARRGFVIREGTTLYIRLVT